MATAVTTAYISAREAVTTYAHKPNATSAQILTPDQQTTRIWVDMRDYEFFMVNAVNQALTGNGLTLIEILGAIDSSGTSPTVILASGTLSGTAVNNGGMLEIKASQIREVGAAASLALRYVTARFTVANSADTLAVTFVRSGAKHPAANLTPATV